MITCSQRQMDSRPKSMCLSLLLVSLVLSLTFSSLPQAPLLPHQQPVKNESSSQDMGIMYRSCPRVMHYDHPDNVISFIWIILLYRRCDRGRREVRPLLILFVRVTNLGPAIDQLAHRRARDIPVGFLVNYLHYGCSTPYLLDQYLANLLRVLDSPGHLRQIRSSAQLAVDARCLLWSSKSSQAPIRPF